MYRYIVIWNGRSMFGRGFSLGGLFTLLTPVGHMSILYHTKLLSLSYQVTLKGRGVMCT